MESQTPFKFLIIALILCIAGAIGILLLMGSQGILPQPLVSS